MTPVQLHCASWVAWTGDEISSHNAAPVGEIPSQLRRRVSATGRKLMSAAWRVCQQTESKPRIVLVSRHGELSRTLGIIASLKEEGEVSPAEFSLAVHHGLAGIFSIVTQNRSGHTAIAAGSDSLGYGLLEAAQYLAENGEYVLLLYFDEVLPEEFSELISQPLYDVGIAALFVRNPDQAQSIKMRVINRKGIADSNFAEKFIEALKNGGSANAAGERTVWLWECSDANS